MCQQLYIYVQTSACKQLQSYVQTFTHVRYGCPHVRYGCQADGSFLPRSIVTFRQKTVHTEPGGAIALLWLYHAV